MKGLSCSETETEDLCHSPAVTPSPPLNSAVIFTYDCRAAFSRQRVYLTQFHNAISHRLISTGNYGHTVKIQVSTLHHFNYLYMYISLYFIRIGLQKHHSHHTKYSANEAAGGYGEPSCCTDL